MSLIVDLVLFLLATVIEAGIVSLIGCVLLRLATWVVCRFAPSYWMTYKAYFVVDVIHIVLRKLLAGTGIVGSFFVLLAIFLVSVGIYSVMIHHPEKGEIGFEKASLIAVIMFFFILAIGQMIKLFNTYAV